MAADLHIHTKLSNGSMGLDEVIALAKIRNVDTISITDHDCISGVARVKNLGLTHNVNIISGSELSSVDEKTGKVVNILCYSPDNTDRLEGLCKTNRQARKWAYMILAREISKNYSIPSAVLTRCSNGSTSGYKQHIMAALIECGLADSVYGSVHDEIFKPGGKNYIDITPKYASTSDVINLIHQSGGVAILSHPMLYNDDTILDRMCELGIDGIEVWHPSASDEDVSKLISYANKQLLMTGGSDFHGQFNKTCNSVGSVSMTDSQFNDFVKSRDRIKRQLKKTIK